MASHLYIGKIPGYNDKIQKNFDYTDRLKNNLTISTFTPIGYSINLGSIWKASGAETIGETNEANTKKEAIYKIGKNLSLTAKIGDKEVTTSTALSNWQQMQQMVAKNSNDFYDTFSIIATNDSTINETISNEYAPNRINDIPGMLGTFGKSAKAAVDTVKNVAQATASSMTSVNSGAMVDLLRSKADLTKNAQGLSLLASQAIGIQTALPKIWQRSDYNNTSSFTVKLISPSGHPADVDRYVIQPLLTLVLAASPITLDGVSYGYPPIWKIQAKGLLNINLAAITAIVITRGGQDTLFNRYNQPTNIDVRLTVEPLVNGFATPLIKGMKYEPDSEDGGAINMLVANPKAITETMHKNTSNLHGFELETLEL